MGSFPRARDTAATASRAPAGPVEAGWLAPPRGHQAEGSPRTKRLGGAVARGAAIVLLLAVAGQAATSWPLDASARPAMPPRCAAVPAALTDDTQAQRAAPARQGAEPVAQAGFGWG